ncbi:Polysulfide reductase, NrfD [Halalkaliarchaeum sp. AArc-CO]|uniref:NrfD/PsrC family molybdoenzyme membrane anchor subunit n=1 Tax=unclassified Halalkaliarchaeum TaxID=2678344 RepID=UPI00217E7807|nr:MULTISPECIES: NrfD/PsrC family molybdoenzyme membrane anchor subunit [unclassified Halalkaliarchaeum]MDR5671557.1 NrfD/PsrC family molybdoenzyme membrane anchor subunit [Halalkaliarchaeum sp. AArc-GB]UWG51057.1 Polysulfide reductase, NrfD [Halalkaliarchaeum sp. AArc-CO]
MSGVEIDPERVLKPLKNTSKQYYILLGLFTLALLLFLEAWVHQITYGVGAVTGIGDWGISGGVPWGLYIGGFVWWIGVAHGGIAISAAVRVINLDKYRPIARIAEVLTVLALGMAALNIVLSMGRPDRIFNTIVQWPFTVHHSPLAWDIAVISLYLVLTLTYMTLSLRSEISALRHRLPTWLAPLYALITLGYRPDEDEKIEQILWWLAVAILALVPLLSGGVVPWLFSLIAAQPGWYGAAAGAAMLTESITSALALVLIMTVVFRYAYGWHDMIEDGILRDLTIVLAFLALATIWFTMHDVLTGYYIAPVNIGALTAGMLELNFFWLAIGGLVVSVVLLFGMIGWPEYFFNTPLLVGVSALLAITILNKKVMFVVEGLMYPTQPPLTNLYPTGVYSPTLVEWILFLGTIMLAGFGFLVISKLIPMIELEKEERELLRPNAETDKTEVE